MAMLTPHRLALYHCCTRLNLSPPPISSPFSWRRRRRPCTVSFVSSRLLSRLQALRLLASHASSWPHPIITVDSGIGDDNDDARISPPPPNHYAGLSEEQVRAVESSETCVRVVAGPGSGKTRVLTHRVIHLISRCGVSPQNILFVTFTNKAAQELRERLEQLFGSETAKQLTVGTFHSICSKILRWYPCSGIDKNFVIYDEKDSERVVKQILGAIPKTMLGKDKQASKISAIQENNIYEGTLEDSFFLSKNKMHKNKEKTLSVPASTLATIHKSLRSARLHMIKCFLNSKRQKAPPKLPGHLCEADLTMSRLYEKTLRRNNAVDFDDLIHLVVRMLHSDHKLREVCEERWKYILVDEFQDTDLLQYELIRLLALKNQNLFVVGDIDQAIFGWRGADLSHMQWALEKDFPSIATFQLRENYRSSSSIVKAASVILKHSHYNRNIGSLHALSLIPVKRYKAVPISIGEFENPRLEASFVVLEMEKLVGQGAATWGSFALLYRTRAQAFELQRALVKAWIPFKVYGAAPFYSHKEIKILISYLQLIANFGNEVALDYCVNVPPRGIGEKSMKTLKNWASDNNLSFPIALEKIYTESLTHKDLGIQAKARNNIFSFIEMIHHLREVCCKVSVLQLLTVVIQKLSFQSYIKALSKDDAEVRLRIERIQQFLSAAEISESRYGVGYQALLSFLEDVALLTNQEEENRDVDPTGGQSKVTLSTLHSSKGLEFDCVFVVGVSDRVLPLEECDPDEERRLFYVGVTRARKQLFLLYSCEPAPWQQAGPNKLSRFVKELIRGLPQHCLNICSITGAREDFKL